jgi:hypothetical protein
MLFNGRTSASQADSAGSIPVIRSLQIARSGDFSILCAVSLQ